MAVAEIIGAAIGTMILLFVAYLLVGNVLTTAEVVSNAQKDLTILSEMRLHTDLRIARAAIAGNAINLTVNNTGNEIITDFPHTDAFVNKLDGSGYSIYHYSEADNVEGTWHCSIFNDYIHPGQLDPGESMFVNVFVPGSTPVGVDVKFCTNNGVYASTIVYG
jgi:archaeal flagellar protein FlaF